MPNSEGEAEEELPEEKSPERPLECSECKKPISVHYTEIVGNTITVTGMCADCPQLQHRLYGTPHPGTPGTSPESAGLACGSCGTTLDSVKMGSPMGCSECYVVFDEALLQEFLLAGKAPPRLAGTKKEMPLHIGRAPGEVNEISPSIRLLALNEALTETLKKEDYEQAAWLRDQIKALTDKEEGQSSAKQ